MEQKDFKTPGARAFREAGKTGVIEENKKGQSRETLIHRRGNQVFKEGRGIIGGK